MAPLLFARRAREGSAGCAGPCSVCGVRSEGRAPRCCADLVGLPTVAMLVSLACCSSDRSGFIGRCRGSMRGMQMRGWRGWFMQAGQQCSRGSLRTALLRRSSYSVSRPAVPVGRRGFRTMARNTAVPRRETRWDVSSGIAWALRCVLEHRGWSWSEGTDGLSRWRHHWKQQTLLLFRLQSHPTVSHGRRWAGTQQQWKASADAAALRYLPTGRQ